MDCAAGKDQYYHKCAGKSRHDEHFQLGAYANMCLWLSPATSCTYRGTA